MALSDEEPLLPRSSSSTHPNFNKSFAAVLAGAALIAMGFVVDHRSFDEMSTLDEKSTTSSIYEFVVPKSDGSREPTSITASNEHLEAYGLEALEYPWMDGLLVEPHHETTFASNGETKSWSISKIDPENSDVLEIVKSVDSASSLVYTFTELGKYSISVDGEESGSVYSYYVRRELRKLSDGARKKLFDAWERVIEVSDEALGRAQYGENFTPFNKLAALHNNYAGAQECDHLHDGMGFVTNHIQMSRLFEASLQAVDSSVSLPYWEYTIDVEEVIAKKSGNFQHWKDMPIWSDTYFGKTNFNTATIDTGILSKVNTVADATYSEVTNSFGLMRAPWNNLNVKKPVRYFGAGGASETKVLGTIVPDSNYMPTCSNLQDMLDSSPTFYKFSTLIGLTAHGPIHLVTGGVAGTPDLIKFVKEELGLSITAPNFPEVWDDVSAFFLVVMRAIYRFKLLEVPSVEECAAWMKANDDDTSGCLATCDAKDVMASAVYKDVLELYDYTSTYTDEELTSLLGLLCSGKVVFGDHGTSSTVLDPSFFSMHAAVERYLQIKRLSGGFSGREVYDEKNGNVWPPRDECLWSTSMHPFSDSCSGHYSDDELLFGAVDGEKFTNLGYYKYLDPGQQKNTYVNDNFKFPHCEAVGVDIHIS